MATTVATAQTDTGTWASGPADHFACLHDALADLLSGLTPSDVEHEKRQRVIDRLAAVVSRLWPGASIRPFGSFLTRLYLPNTGDLDLRIDHACIDVKTRLAALGSALLQCTNFASRVEYIGKARTPIVKYVDIVANIPVDVVWYKEESIVTTNYIEKQLEETKFASELLLLMKLYLKRREQAETYRGGIGSFLLLVMVLYYLKAKAASEVDTAKPLGRLLLGFLHFYANCDSELGISVTNDIPRTFPKSERGWKYARKPSLIAVESPVPPFRDIGESSYRMPVIRSSFHSTANEILNADKRHPSEIIDVLFKRWY